MAIALLAAAAATAATGGCCRRSFASSDLFRNSISSDGEVALAPLFKIFKRTDSKFETQFRLTSHFVDWVTVTAEIKTMAEETRVRIRAARRHAMDAAKKMQKDGTLTEDDLKSGETQIQKLTDKFVADVDSQVASKEADIMKI